jgi:hypothetical protein
VREKTSKEKIQGPPKLEMEHREEFSMKEI